MSWEHTYNVLSRNIMPRANDAPVYGGDRDVYTEAMLALTYDTWSANQKTQIAIALVQMAIDITVRAEQGAIWQDNGGHCAGQKAIVALAAHLTGHQRFIDALGYTTTLFVHGGGSASIWGEDRQIFRITQADVNRDKAFPYRADQIGQAEWSGDATRKNPDTDPEERHNSLGVLTPEKNPDLKQDYRHIIAGVTVPSALALRLMGAADLMDGDWLDYQDRYMQARIAAGTALPNGQHNDVSPWVINAWVRDRAGAGVGGGTGTPTPPAAPSITRIFPDDSNTRAIVLHGQSNEWYAFNSQQSSSYQNYNSPRPTITTPNIRYIGTARHQDQAAGLQNILVDNAAYQGDKVNISFGPLSIFLDRIAPGRSLILALKSIPSYGRYQEMNDADTTRRWENRVYVNNALIQYREADAIIEHWDAKDGPTFPNFDIEWSPLYRGMRAAGAVHALGTPNPDSIRHPSVPVDHCYWDDSVDGKGRGIYPKSTRWTNVPESHDTRANVAGIGRFRDLPGIEDRLLPVASPVDWYYGGGHASASDPDGQVYYMWCFSKSIAEVMLNRVIPEPTVKRYEEGPNGSYVDVIIDLPNNGDLKTHLTGTGRNPPSNPLPYQTDVVGAAIRRSGMSKPHAVIRPGTSGYSSNLQGTVTIVDTGTGSAPYREGRIRVRPNVPFGPGEYVNYRMYPGEATFGGDSTTHSAKPFLQHACEIVPGWTDLSAMYPHPGIPLQFATSEGYTTTEDSNVTGSPNDPGAGGGVGSGGGEPDPDPDPDPAPDPDPEVTDYFTTGASGPYFVDPDDLPAGIVRIRVSATVRRTATSDATTGHTVFASQESTGNDWQMQTLQKSVRVLPASVRGQHRGAAKPQRDELAEPRPEPVHELRPGYRPPGRTASGRAGRSPGGHVAGHLGEHRRIPGRARPDVPRAIRRHAACPGGAGYCQAGILAQDGGRRGIPLQDGRRRRPER